MNKAELISSVAKSANVTKVKAKMVLNNVLKRPDESRRDSNFSIILIIRGLCRRVPCIDRHTNGAGHMARVERPLIPRVQVADGAERRQCHGRADSRRARAEPRRRLHGRLKKELGCELPVARVNPP